MFLDSTGRKNRPHKASKYMYKQSVQNLEKYLPSSIMNQSFVALAPSLQKTSPCLNYRQPSFCMYAEFHAPMTLPTTGMHALPTTRCLAPVSFSFK